MTRFKNLDRTGFVINFIYGVLGLAGSLALVRLVLRLLAADELSPIGNGLAQLGGLVVAPFKLLVKNPTTAALPGSAFEPAALVAVLVYWGLIGIVVLAVSLLKLRQNSATDSQHIG